MTAALSSAAFRYALRRVAIFSLAPGSKVPIKGSHGLRDASDDQDVARSRWQRNPQANIGAATGRASGFWVFDIDMPHGPESLAALEAEHGALPVTIEASTPGGGWHLYWRWCAGGNLMTDNTAHAQGYEETTVIKASKAAECVVGHVNGREIRNSAGRVGTGLDVRGEGGSIVLPPSILADGRCYRWVKNGASTFADAPGWLVKLALPPPPPPRAEPRPPPDNISNYVASAAASELSNLSAAQKGTRNHTLNRCAFNLAGFVKAGALPEDWTRGQLEAHAVGAGLSIAEARQTIESAFRAAQPRSLPR